MIFSARSNVLVQARSDHNIDIIDTQLASIEKGKWTGWSCKYNLVHKYVSSKRTNTKFIKRNNLTKGG